MRLRKPYSLTRNRAFAGEASGVGIVGGEDRQLPFVRATAVMLVAITLSHAPTADESDPEPKALALRLIDRFYDGLAPGSSALAQFIGDGYQIIGSDGLRFDRDGYLAFPKQIITYEVTNIIARREGDVLTARSRSAMSVPSMA
jgi:hypothetical protein